MKTLYILLITILIQQFAFGQTITINPLESAEYCPDVEFTFSVSIEASSIGDEINVNGGASITEEIYDKVKNGNTISFKFKGKFYDANVNQQFILPYKDLNNESQNKTFTFTKIKSLFHVSSANTISLNTVSLIAQRCQVQNFNISFTNVKYGNPFVFPAISYGSITNYEYQLPSGWSIGGSTSTGSNWIAGGNNVTVTSDLGTGDGLFVKIRPVNTACGTSLSPGPTKLIAISRSAPTLAIPETQTDICSGSVNYTLTGLPAGATTVWSITNNNSVASISNATNNSVTVNKISANRGVEILTATVTHCSYTYNVTKTLNFGSPVSSFEIQNYLPLEVDCYQTQSFYIF
jgi:hypothetical protein